MFTVDEKKQKEREYNKEYYKKNHERILRHKKLCPQKRPEDYLLRYRLYGKSWRLRLRMSVFNIIGKQCVSCGESDIKKLHFDHINGGGYAEVKRFGSKRKMYIYYRERPEEAKEKLQPLCDKCNYDKGRLSNEEWNLIVEFRKKKLAKALKLGLTKSY